MWHAIMPHVQEVEEFLSIFPSCDTRLRNVWPRAEILQKAEELATDDADVQNVLSGLHD